MQNTAPIGVFDSGIGGLSVLKALISLMPRENYLYVADQHNVPYGNKSTAEIQLFSKKITEFLLSQNAKIIVVACNTATAAAIQFLRQTFPQTIFIGMEPAVKPAAQLTKTGKVGVLATAGTIKSERYAGLMQKFAADVEVFEDPCIGLVPLIERGEFSTAETKKLLAKILTPMLENSVDTLVLGCTHYPFVIPAIRKIVGQKMEIINPAPAVARHTMSLLQQSNEEGKTGNITLYTTGELSNFERQVKLLLPEMPENAGISELRLF